MNKDDIRQVVQRRVSEYEDQTKLQWFEQWFLPALAAIGLRCITWEELLAVVSENDEVDGRELGDFYEKCLGFNKFVAKRYAVMVE